MRLPLLFLVLTQALTPRSTPPSQITLDLISPTAPPPSLTLLDNKTRIPITPIHQPAQLLFVLDAINSSPADLGRSSDALQSYLTLAPTPLPQPTTILILSGTAPKTLTDTTALTPRELYVHRIPSTTDAPTLLHALRVYQPTLSRILQSQSGPGQAEHVRLSLEALSFIAQAQTAVPGPKVVLWLSPGWPFLASSNARSSTQLFDSVVYFSNLLRNARVLLYSLNPLGLTSQDHSAQTEAFLLATRPGSIGPSSHPSIPSIQDPDFYTSFLTLPRDPRHADPNDLSLQVLATQTGGLVIQQNNDLRAAIQRCAAEAQSIYTLTYTPLSLPADATGYHDLHLTPASPGQRLRPAFYAR